jgi:hypothetical protein
MNTEPPFQEHPSVACSRKSLTRANGIPGDESPQVYGTDLHNPAQPGIAPQKETWPTTTLMGMGG